MSETLRAGCPHPLPARLRKALSPCGRASTWETGMEAEPPETDRRGPASATQTRTVCGRSGRFQLTIQDGSAFPVLSPPWRSKTTGPLSAKLSPTEARLMAISCMDLVAETPCCAAAGAASSAATKPPASKRTAHPQLPNAMASLPLPAHAELKAARHWVYRRAGHFT
jgi:hypothetical protein